MTSRHKNKRVYDVRKNTLKRANVAKRRLTLVIAVGHSTPSNTLYLNLVVVLCMGMLSKSRHFQLTRVQTRLDTIYERLCVRE